MTKSPLSGVGGGGAYIDRTVDKVSFVIFVMTQSDRLPRFLSILTRSPYGSSIVHFFPVKGA